MLDQLKEHAKCFAQQGGVDIGPWLERYAGEVEAGEAIVELGCWLGAGTAHLALGAMKSGAPIYTYDRFVCINEEERGKAEKFGLQFKIGQDTLPYVRGMLKPFPTAIHYCKGTYRSEFPWVKQRIGLYVDDLTKTDDRWLPAMKAFLPFFIPGKTHLFLMDYHFDESAGPKYAAQKRYIAANASKFELIAERMGATTTALFRYLG
jgi:hypothetical protein